MFPVYYILLGKYGKNSLKRASYDRNIVPTLSEYLSDYLLLCQSA
jgi:hypothetical protein